jgi:putative spermidine/putrescine transport system substrate-binding protein
MEPDPARDRRPGLSRREFVVGAAVAAASTSALGSRVARATKRGPDGDPPAVDRFTGVLRVNTLGVEWPKGILQQAERDLDFKINLQVHTSVEQVEKAMTAPESFDVFAGHGYQAMRVWSTGHLRPIDTRRLAAWPHLYRLFAWGTLEPGSKRCRYGVGDAPFRSLFLRKGTAGLPLTSARPPRNTQIVQWIDEQTGRPYRGRPMPRYVVGVPAYFGFETIGYLPDVMHKLPRRVSWAELLNRRWKSRVALQADPGVALLDAGNAVQALGLMRFGNLGSMTAPEIDSLVKILIRYQKLGQFRAMWSTFNDSVNLMASKDVAISPLWPSAFVRLAAEGIDVREAAPPEGYRGSCSAVGISASVKERLRLNACYDYLNWLYDGSFGASMMRQGYYVGNGKALPGWIDVYGGRVPPNQDELTGAEYDYWYRGKRATKDLSDVTGKIGAIKKGSIREGGGLAARACHVSCWSTYFHAAAYQAKRFDDLLST